MKKYKILNEDSIVTDTGATLYRIQALKSFADVKEGDLGGYMGITIYTILLGCAVMRMYAVQHRYTVK